MEKKMVLLSLIYLLNLACSNNKINEKKVAPSNDMVGRSDSNKHQVDTFKENVFLLDSFSKKHSKTRIFIKTLNTFLDTASQYLERNKTKCATWKLTSEDVKKILTKSQPIDSHEFHYLYDVFPCYYIGQLIINEKNAIYKINAGGFSVIQFKDTSLTLGYKFKDYKKYFLLGPGID